MLSIMIICYFPAYNNKVFGFYVNIRLELPRAKCFRNDIMMNNVYIYNKIITLSCPDVNKGNRKNENILTKR